MVIYMNPQSVFGLWREGVKAVIVIEQAVCARLTHILGCGPDACVRAVDFCSPKQDEGGVGEIPLFHLGQSLH